jgi:hypothetical protein
MSECYCDFDDVAVFYEAKDVARARKLYFCHECSRAIFPGESYERVYGIWPTIDGPDVMRTCAWCMELKEWIQAHVPCFCFAHGYLIEGAGEAVEEYAHETDGLRFGYLRRKALIYRRPTRTTLEESVVR